MSLHTPTLTPIFTHDKLEPIMTSTHFSPIIPGPASTDSLTGTTSAGRENEGVNGEQGENLTSTDSLTGTTSSGRENEGVNGEQGANFTSTDASTDSLTDTTSARRESDGVNGEQGENLTSTESHSCSKRVSYQVVLVLVEQFGKNFSSHFVNIDIAQGG